MSKKALLVLLILIVAVASITIYFVSFRTSGIAGIKVVSTPSGSVFLNDKMAGKTPYEDKQPAGDYVIKIIPDNSTSQSIAWQAKIKLNPSVLTYINRDLGQSELTSAGEILSLEKVPQNQAQLVIFSQPDATSVLVNGQDRGITPVSISDLPAGDQEVVISAPGYKSRTTHVQTTSGYKLVVNFQLALSDATQPQASGSATPVTTPSVSSGQGSDIVKPYVTIKDTPTGFLRVRSGPSTGESEVAQIKPGNKYKYLDQKDGWYKIAYEDGKEGWISSRYADLVQ